MEPPRVRGVVCHKKYGEHRPLMFTGHAPESTRPQCGGRVTAGQEFLGPDVPGTDGTTLRRSRWLAFRAASDRIRPCGEACCV